MENSIDDQGCLNNISSNNAFASPSGKFVLADQQAIESIQEKLTAWALVALLMR